MNSLLLKAAKLSLAGVDGLGRLVDRLAAPRPDKRQVAVRRMLIWSMDRIGDLVRATPAIRIIKKHFADAQVTCVAADRAAEALQHNPWIDRLEVVNRPHSPTRQFRAVCRLRNVSWDLAVLLEVDPHWKRLGQWWMRYLRVPRWVELDFGTGGSRRAERVSLHHDQSWVEQFLRLGQALGATPDDDGLELHLTEVERQWAGAFLAQEGIPASQPFFLIHPASQLLTVSRQWPAESFAELIDLLQRRWSWPVALTGLEQDRATILAIQQRIRKPVINLSGRLNLRQLCAVIGQNTLCISNDTGPLHLAQALGRPAVAVLGPTSPKVVGIMPSTLAVRLDLPCSPCAFAQGWTTCSNPRRWQCLTELGATQVFEAVNSQVRSYFAL